MKVNKLYERCTHVVKYNYETEVIDLRAENKSKAYPDPHKEKGASSVFNAMKENER